MKDCCKIKENHGPLTKHETADVHYTTCKVCGCRHFQATADLDLFAMSDKFRDLQDKVREVISENRPVVDVWLARPDGKAPVAHLLGRVIDKVPKVNVLVARSIIAVMLKKEKDALQGAV